MVLSLLNAGRLLLFLTVIQYCSLSAVAQGIDNFKNLFPSITVKNTIIEHDNKIKKRFWRQQANGH
jgi:hypothetical protein